MLESGAIYRNIPAHGIGFSRHPAGVWRPKDVQTWDCYGERFTTLEYRYLAGLEVKVKCDDVVYGGEYMFTVAPIGDGFSAYPEQAKEFCFVRLVLQPRLGSLDAALGA
jgi:hypothetical protein